MRRVARSVGWLFDYRNGLTMVASVLVGLLAIAFIDGIDTRTKALEALRAQETQQTSARKATIARIDSLEDEIGGLRGQLVAAGQRQGELLAGIAALSEQVRRLGGRPIVAARPDGSTTTPTTTTTAVPPATPTPTRPSPPPSSSPSTTRPPSCPTLPVVGCRP